jgi:ferredoxin
MIIGEWKPVPELIQMLRDHKKVLLVGCATCMAECAAGGEREVETLAPLLRLALSEGGSAAEVVTRVLERQCEFEFVETLAEVSDGADAVMSLGCGIGVQAVAERFSGIPVYPAINTTALAVRQEAGMWAERCAACGDCVLGETYGYCPVARCAKSLFNGPCGGTRDGEKCEVDESADCVWCLIYERAKERGSVETLLTVRKPKNWSNSRHGGVKKMVREDLRI